MYGLVEGWKEMKEKTDELWDQNEQENEEWIESKEKSERI